MPALDIDDQTHHGLRILAAAWSTSEGGAVAELLRRFEHSSTPSATGDDEVLIHAIYKGIRTEGVYRRRSRSITITSGPLEAQSFESPSPAARATVASISPDVNPHRNGWSFWVVSDTGQTLQSIRRA